MVKGEKVSFGHINLAADFQNPGGICRKLLRQEADGPEVGGDVFAGGAVAPGSALNESSVFIAGRERQTVNFGFGHKVDAVCGVKKTFDAQDKIVHFFKAEDVSQRKHGKTMGNFAESAFERCADFF